MSQQDDNLDRVSARIGAAILEFYWLRTEAGQPEFHVEDLRRHVNATVGMTAPGSSDRVMRDLRQKGIIFYKLLNRAESLYLIQDKVSAAQSPSDPIQGELF